MASKQVAIIDGGVGTEISRRGIPLHPVYWSAAAHVEHPDIVSAIHLDYINAGVDIISTNTFMTGRHVLEAGGRNDFKEINLKAIELAKMARQLSGKDHLKIAGTLSPTARMDQANGLPRGKEIENNFRDQASLLADSGADVLLVEMLFDSESAASLLDACCDTGLPVWAGLSATKMPGKETLMTFRQPGKHESLAHETFDNLIKTVIEFPIEVLGAMHTDVKLMPEALRSIRNHWSGTILAYAKTGTATDHDWEFSDVINEIEYADIISDWVDEFDISIVGGCCGTSPAHIKALVKRLNR